MSFAMVRMDSRTTEQMQLGASGPDLEMATCPVCKSEGVPVFTQSDLFCGLPGEFGQRYCAGCSAYFLSPRVPESQIGYYYPDVYEPYQKTSHPKLADKVARALGLYSRRRRIVERFIKRGRILDVGCGSGEFLESLAGGPWERYAMDIEWHGRHGLRDGFHEGQFDHEPPPFTELDAITLWHVFEHLYHPQGALDNAAKLLRPGGCLYRLTPIFRPGASPAVAGDQERRSSFAALTSPALSFCVSVDPPRSCAREGVCCTAVIFVCTSSFRCTTTGKTRWNASSCCKRRATSNSRS